MFRQHLLGHGLVDMHCASGTVFNETTCNCQFDASRKHLRKGMYTIKSRYHGTDRIHIVYCENSS